MRVAISLIVLCCAVSAIAAPVPECFTVHGRLQIANGIPSARIWQIGTKKMFGIPDGRPGHEDETLPPNLRRVIQRNFLTRAFGDFYVCPLSDARPGQMQLVRLVRARITAVQHP